MLSKSIVTIDIIIQKLNPDFRLENWETKITTSNREKQLKKWDLSHMNNLIFFINDLAKEYALENYYSLKKGNGLDYSIIFNEILEKYPISILQFSGGQDLELVSKFKDKAKIIYAIQNG
jgi:hypothetical protein